MLIEVDANDYKKHFQNKVNPFLKQDFINLNAKKVDKVVRLIQDQGKVTIGLIAGIKNNRLISPFSAPFGGFDYKKENAYIHELESFVKDLLEYIQQKQFDEVSITFPPTIYESTFNSKMINVLNRNQFYSNVPDITNWVDLKRFNNRFSQKNSREYYNQSLRNGLAFTKVETLEEKEKVYFLIKQNRERFGRPIFMNFEDIINTSILWPVDFFGVHSKDKELVSAGIFYQFSENIAFALFWGDNEAGRPLRAMDFLSFKLWSHYKEKGLSYIDLGISTESGIPNEGLLRFKETHESISSVKYSFKWRPKKFDSEV